MSGIAALVRSMANAGATGELIALAVEAVEAEQQKLADKRAEAAERKRIQRDKERQERDGHATVTRQSQDNHGTIPLDKGSPDTPSKTQSESAPLTPQPRGKKRGIPIPPDWQPPPIAELSEKAKEYASKWPHGRYAAEAEAFVAFWVNDGRCRPDWRLTWISRIISIHSQVMRDARFAPPPPIGRTDKPMNAEQLRAAIRFAEDNSDPERAAELTRQLRTLKERPPDPKVAAIIGQTAQRMSAH